MKGFISVCCDLVIGVTGFYTVLGMLTPWHDMFHKLGQVVGFVIIAVVMMIVKDVIKNEDIEE